MPFQPPSAREFLGLPEPPCCIPTPPPPSTDDTLAPAAPLVEEPSPQSTTLPPSDVKDHLETPAPLLEGWTFMRQQEAAFRASQEVGDSKGNEDVEMQVDDKDIQMDDGSVEVERQKHAGKTAKLRPRTPPEEERSERRG